MTPTEVFITLIRGIEDQRRSDLPQLYAEDTVVTHPLDPSRAGPLRGRKAIAAHFGVGNEVALPQIPERKAIDVHIHETTDPEVIVAEFAYRISKEDGTNADFPCLFVLRVRDGQIVSSHDYIDPIGRALALGQAKDLCHYIQILSDPD